MDYLTSAYQKKNIVSPEVDLILFGLNLENNFFKKYFLASEIKLGASGVED